MRRGSAARQKQKSDRLLRAAELAADLGQPELLERLLRQANLDEADPLAPARVAWCREISQPPTVDDPSKIPALVGLRRSGPRRGAKDLASNLLWRAAQRCWWSNASEEVRTKVLVAADRLELQDTDPRLIAIYGYVEPLRRGGDLYVKLRGLSEKKGQRSRCCANPRKHCRCHRRLRPQPGLSRRVQRRPPCTGDGLATWRACFLRRGGPKWKSATGRAR